MRGVFAWTVATVVFLTGLYVVLRVSGLTQLALTVVGGTGLIGLALGIAFRDITENFLASIFLSLQQPFGTGDLIEVAGETGYVQQLNVRCTVLMTPRRQHRADPQCFRVQGQPAELHRRTPTGGSILPSASDTTMPSTRRKKLPAS